MNGTPSVLPPDFVALCDRRARKRICATTWNEKTGREEILGFRFHPLIADWPICREAEANGWGRDLRAAMIATLSRAMRHGDDPELKDVLPKDDWIANTRKNAERYRKAAEYQAQNLPSTFNARKFLGSLMASGEDLTEKSKSMAGDR